MHWYFNILLNKTYIISKCEDFYWKLFNFTYIYIYIYILKVMYHYILLFYSFKNIILFYLYYLHFIIIKILKEILLFKCFLNFNMKSK